MRPEISNGLAIRFLGLFCFASALCLAKTLSGPLVDAKCYESVEWNHNVTASTVVQDLNMDVRLCAPNARTSVFAILPPDGDDMLTLDPVSNAKAAEFVRSVGRKSPLYVTVEGEINKNTIDLKSIVAAK